MPLGLHVSAQTPQTAACRRTLLFRGDDLDELGSNDEEGRGELVA